MEVAADLIAASATEVVSGLALVLAVALSRMVARVAELAAAKARLPVRSVWMVCSVSEEGAWHHLEDHIVRWVGK